jgi:hypothetical protein
MLLGYHASGFFAFEELKVHKIQDSSHMSHNDVG